ncbi:MAG: hypothetical protein WC829_20275 [Hyphomicrobium sp.]|jgi:hypothetical protein
MWACLATAIAGLVTGLRFRAPMLFIAALFLTIATIGVAIYLQWSVARTVMALVLLLAIHQISYLIGLFAASRR